MQSAKLLHDQRQIWQSLLLDDEYGPRIGQIYRGESTLTYSPGEASLAQQMIHDRCHNDARRTCPRRATAGIVAALRAAGLPAHAARCGRCCTLCGDQLQRNDEKPVTDAQ